MLPMGAGGQPLHTETKQPVLTPKRLPKLTDDPEQRAQEVEKKKPRLEAEMASILQRKKEFDNSLKAF